MSKEKENKKTTKKSASKAQEALADLQKIQAAPEKTAEEKNKSRPADEEKWPEGEVTSKGEFRGKKIAETPSGKEIRIRKVASGMAMWEIVFYPGGELPDILKGLWTSEYSANKVIQQYLEIQLAKANKK